MMTNLIHSNCKKKRLIIKIRNSKHKIYYTNLNISLLSILENSNIIIESQCRNGYCGSCRIILLKGKVIYNKKNLPIASKFFEKEIFPCCCKAQGNIEIEI